MESIGATKGTMTLTTNLYKPFTRLDKYPSLLKELERHIEVRKLYKAWHNGGGRVPHALII